MPQRKLASVLPEPVGAQISVLAPREIARQPPAWACVGPSNEASNQRRTGALNGASGSSAVVVFFAELNPLILRSHDRRPARPAPKSRSGSWGQGVPPAKRTKANQDFFGLKPSPNRPEPSQKLQAPFVSSTENQ